MPIQCLSCCLFLQLFFFLVRHFDNPKLFGVYPDSWPLRGSRMVPRKERREPGGEWKIEKFEAWSWGWLGAVMEAVFPIGIRSCCHAPLACWGYGESYFAAVRLQWNALHVFSVSKLVCIVRIPLKIHSASFYGKLSCSGDDGGNTPQGIVVLSVDGRLWDIKLSLHDENDQSGYLSHKDR